MKLKPFPSLSITKGPFSTKRPNIEFAPGPPWSQSSSGAEGDSVCYNINIVAGYRYCSHRNYTAYLSWKKPEKQVAIVLLVNSKISWM